MRIFLFLITAILIVFSSVEAATTIGNGYKCSGKVISKGSKKVTALTAKATLAEKSKAAKAKLKKLNKQGASAQAIAAQQAVIDAIKQSVANINLCSKGKFDGVVDAYWKTLAKFFVGTYTIAPYGISDEASFGFTLNGSKLSMSLSLGGLASTPLEYRGLTGVQLNPVSSSFPAKLKDTTTDFGSMSFTVDKHGPFSIDITSVPTNKLGIAHIVVSGHRIGDVITATADLRDANEGMVATMQIDLRGE